MPADICPIRRDRCPHAAACLAATCAHHRDHRPCGEAALTKTEQYAMMVREARAAAQSRPTPDSTGKRA